MSENGKLLTRDELLKKCQRRYRHVSLPSGGKVLIQSLNEKEYSEYELPTRAKFGDAFDQAMASHRRRLIVGVVVDDNKQRLFRDTDVAFIEDMDVADAQAIFNAAWDHLAMGARAVESESKNSDTPPADEQPPN